MTTAQFIAGLAPIVAGVVIIAALLWGRRV